MFRRNVLLGIALSLISVFCTSGVMTAATDDSRVANAAMKGDIEFVRTLLKQAADVNGAQGDGSTALHWAAQNGDPAMAQLLIYAGANVRAKTRIGGYTPLFMASKRGSSSVVDILLKSGSDSKLKASNGITPLMLAAISGDRDAVRLLIEAGAEVNAKENGHGQTPLMFAAAFDRPEAIDELVKHGAELNAATEVHQPPQRPNLGQGQGQIQLLSRDQGLGPRGQTSVAAPPAAGQRRGTKPVTDVSGAPQLQRQQQLEPSPAQRSSNSPKGGLTPLMYAARDGRLNAIKALLASGANLNVQSGDKSTALLIATINGHFDVAKYLVEHGADVNLTSMDDASPLYGVLHVQWSKESERPQPSIKREETNYLDLMTLMLDSGANPNAKLTRVLWYTSFGNPYESASVIGTTPFWKCAAVGDVDGMKLLLSRGADPNVVNKDGVTALLIAAGAGTHGNDDVMAPQGRLAAVKFLVEELNLDVNASDNGNTGSRNEGFATGPQSGPQQNQQSQEPLESQLMGLGYTALHNAAGRGDNEMILYLVSKGAKVDAVTITGVSVVDMANGPRQRVQPYASTIALLELLGAKNSHKCVSC